MKKNENGGMLTIEPLTEKNWAKFTALFGEKGACCNCWCMYYRLENKAFKEGLKNATNKASMKQLVNQGKPVGLLGISDGEAVAWCALSPREDFIRFEKSRSQKKIDNEPVWSIPCLFIDKKLRGKGISGKMIKGAIQYAEKTGIKILEAYPVNPVNGKIPNTSAWYGIYKVFEKEGFEIVSDENPNRPIVRYHVSIK